MANNTTPNMGLVVPVPQSEQGPDYATEISNDLTNVIDSHDHSSGRGVAITPAGINISSDLTYNANNLVQVRAVRYTSQLSNLNEPGDVNATFVDQGELCYIDGSGQLVPIT